MNDKKRNRDDGGMERQLLKNEKKQKISDDNNNNNTPVVDLMTLEEKIKALEESLENSSSSSSSSSSDSSDSDDSDVDNDEDLRIPPLPPDQLPEYYKKTNEKKKNNNNNQYQDRRDSKYWQKQLNEAMKSYVPSQNRPLYCRICKLDFNNETELMEHRRSMEHRNAAKLERQMTYCNICDKQFTSVKQLVKMYPQA